MSAQIMTVCGLVAPAELGVTDAHSHVWIEPVEGANLAGLILDDVSAIATELQDYKAQGGGAIVDCQPGGVGRNGLQLRTISEASGVHIIASTGFHLRRYYPPDAALWSMTIVAAADYFLNEIEYGLQESRDAVSPVYPGVIKIAAELTLATSPIALFEAAAAAARLSGLAIEMHTEQGADVARLLEFFLAQGVPPQQLVFCHVDKRPDFGLHQELARAGVLLEYDTFVRPKYQPDQNAWPLLRQMIAAGLAGSVALPTDCALTSMWLNFGGGPGPAAFLTQVAARLNSLQVDPNTETDLLGRNIARRLAVAQPELQEKA